MVNQADILQGKILIVDDEPPNILLLERVLHGAGYTAVSSTRDPGQVCELHLRNRYDLIMLDLQMPGMDGFQVMENLKEIEAGGYLPVLVVTALREHKLRALKAGAKDFVSKPFDLSEVLVRVHNMLEVRLLHVRLKAMYERVLAEQAVSGRLLRTAGPRMLEPHPVTLPAPSAAMAKDLISGSAAEVTVLFTDALDLTNFAVGASAQVLVEVLDDLGERFGSGDGTPRIDRAKTIGAAYLAGVGMPAQIVDRSIRAAHLAVDLAEAVDRFNAHSQHKVKVRIGLETTEGKKGKRKVTRDV